MLVSDSHTYTRIKALCNYVTFSSGTLGALYRPIVDAFYLLLRKDVSRLTCQTKQKAFEFWYTLRPESWLPLQIIIAC